MAKKTKKNQNGQNDYKMAKKSFDQKKVKDARRTRIDKKA